MKSAMPFAGRLMTSGMGILPHRYLDDAMELVMGLDIPFWPQLPKISYYEDMYVQATERFPGIIVEADAAKLHFDTEKFYAELEEVLNNFENEEFFRITPQYSATYRRFLSNDLSGYAAIRGQQEGPVSVGLAILDEGKKPIIYNDEVRSLLFDFMARKANAQLHELKAHNPNAFLFIDEPGLQYIFSAMSGYSNDHAKEDMEGFFAQIERPRGVHLCGNPDWDFLLNLDIDILSFNSYNLGEIFVKYRDGIKSFLSSGKMLSWGIVPSNTDDYVKETEDGLSHLIESLWGELRGYGFDLEQILEQSILMPATCSLMNQDGAATVNKSYRSLKALSCRLRSKYLVSGL
mgnify:CR=1 FL=1